MKATCCHPVRDISVLTTLVARNTYVLISITHAVPYYQDCYLRLHCMTHLCAQNVVLVSIPSVMDADLAPPGKHTLHAYLPATEPWSLWEGA